MRCLQTFLKFCPRINGVPASDTSAFPFAEAQWSKNRCFSSAHPKVLADLPPFIQRQYEEQFLVTHRGALDRVLFNLVQGLTIAGVAFALCARLIKESHALQFYACKETYLLYHEALQKSERSSIRNFFKPSNPASVGPSSTQGADPSPPQPAQITPIPDFGEFESGTGYRSYVPSTGYLTSVYLAEFESRKQWIHQQLVHVDGRYVKLDHTFKVCKMIRTADGKKAFLGVMTVMNEYGQIVFQKMTQTTSLDEVSGDFQKIRARYAAHGFQPMEIAWVDNPRTTSAKVKASLGVDLVLNDPLHALMLVSCTIPDDHSLKGLLMTRMSQAMFKTVEGDKALLVDYLRRSGLSEGDIARKPAAYFKRHCRRVIPTATELGTRLDQVFQGLQYAYDTATGVTLFNKATTQAFINEMFIQTGTWGGGIPCYTAIRGSSQLEGYHRHLALVLSGANNSPQLAHAQLSDHKVDWNRRAAITKRGQRDYLISDLRRIERIKAASARLNMVDPYPEYVVLCFDSNELFGCDGVLAGLDGNAVSSFDMLKEAELPKVVDDGGASLLEVDFDENKEPLVALFKPDAPPIGVPVATPSPTGATRPAELVPPGAAATPLAA
ncbi:hypothetical protein KFL_005690120, partial [Klebsormidium nitens]